MRPSSETLTMASRDDSTTAARCALCSSASASAATLWVVSMTLIITPCHVPFPHRAVVADQASQQLAPVLAYTPSMTGNRKRLSRERPAVLLEPRASGVAVCATMRARDERDNGAVATGAAYW